MGALFAVVMSTLIGIMTIPVIRQAINANLNAIVLADAASQFQTVLAGAQKYVAANKDALTDTLSVGGSYQEIPFADLLNTDSVPTGFSQTNVLGATWHVYAQQPASGAVRTMVAATGGRPLTQSDMVKIAGLTGDLGGYIPYDGMMGNLNSSTAHGTTWNLPLAGLPSPGPGHLFGTTTVGDAASPTIDTNDFLYRVGVPGHDNLNTMDVALNMGNNPINHSGNIGTTGHDAMTDWPSAWSHTGITTGDVYSSGTIGVGVGGALMAYINQDGFFNSSSGVASQIMRPRFIATANTACDGVPIPMQDFGAGLDVGGPTTLTTLNGDIARDADGNPLACVKGKWTPLGGSTTVVSGVSGEAGSWTLTEMNDASVPTGIRKRLTGESPFIVPKGSTDFYMDIRFPVSFTAIFPGAYGVSTVAVPNASGGHDDSSSVVGTPTLNGMSIMFNSFGGDAGSSSPGWLTWWVEGY